MVGKAQKGITDADNGGFSLILKIYGKKGKVSNKTF